MRVFVILVLACSATFAHPVDSGRCPWKLPFQLTLHAYGTVHKTHDIVPTHGPQTHTEDTYVATDDRDVVIDTATWSLSGVTKLVELSVVADTLRYREYYEIASGLSYPFDTIDVAIAFVNGTDSIGSISYHEVRTLTAMNNATSDVYDFSIAGLLYDDTSIYVRDSSFAGHYVAYSHRHADLTYFETTQSPQFGDFTHEDFKASSLGLSGLFRAVTLASPASVERPARRDRSLQVVAGTCRFAPVSEPTHLEVFRVDGTLAASIAIGPSATTTRIPQLPAGFYFLRLNSETIGVRIGSGG